MKRLLMLCTIFVLALSIGQVSAQSETTILQVAVSDFAEDTIQLATEAFEQQNPDVQVQLVSYDGFGFPANPNNDAETYQEDLATYFQSADVVLVNDDMNTEATRAGYVLDLMPLTQSDPNYNASNYNSTMVDAFNWDFGQWALPISSTFVTLSYSTEAFDTAGLNYPNGNWTLNDLIFAAQSLTQYNADGSIALPGLIVQGGSSLDSLLISAYGQSVADDNAFPSIPNYSDPSLATLLDQWYAFESEGYTTLPADADNNEVPIQIGNPQQGGGGRFGNANQTRNATALLPGGSSVMNVIGYAVSSGTNYPMQAYELTRHLTQDANAISVSGGTVPALINAPEAEANVGPGGFRGGQNVTAAFEPLVDTAVMNGLNQSDMRFTAGLSDALDLMASDGLTASDALTTALDEQNARLVVADESAQTTTIVVNTPVIAPTIGAGEIVLEFAVLTGGGRGSGAIADTWEIIAEEFVLQDSQVAQINIEQAPPNVDALPETTECYYSSSNIVSDLDLSTVLSLDPLLLSDPNYDANDYIVGVLQQVQVDGMTYAMPVSITPLVLRASSDAFSQAGIAIPQGSWTVSEFEDALRQLSSVVDAGTAPFAVTGSTPLINLIAIYGGQPFDLSTDPITLNFTDPATVAAVQQVLSLAENGLISYSDGGGGGNANPIIEQSLVGGGGFGGGNNANADRVTIGFPIGTQSNAVAFDLGTMYISSNAQNPDACYRFMSYVSQNADIFDTMPVTQSLLNSNNLLNSQGQATVDFYQATADLLAQPTTVAYPTNINQIGFGMTQWLTAVFDSYLNGEIVSLDEALLDAQQRTAEYLTCVDSLELDVAGGNFQQFQTDLQACVVSANT